MRAGSLATGMATDHGRCWGTFGRVEITVPRAPGSTAQEGKTTEWKSTALRGLSAGEPSRPMR